MRIKVAGGTGVIELPMSDAELNVRLRRMGVRDVVPRCSLVRVMDAENPLSRLEGQIVNMDEVNFFAKRMESLTSYEQSVMAAFVNEKGAESLKDLINLTYSMKGLSLITDFSDASKVGRRLYLDEFIGMSISEEQGTDFLQFAEKTFRESNVEVLPYGVFVEHGFEMQEVYNGKTFPQYYYDSDKTVCSVEIQNQSGDTEYLYLPTDIWARNGKKKIVWRCSNRLTGGVKKCGDSETLEEGALNRAVMEAIHRITRNDGDFVGAFRQNVIRVIGSYGKEQQPDEYEGKIKAKQEEMVALIAENAKEGSYTQEFDERYRRIAEEINALKEEQAEAKRKKKLAEDYEQRVKDMDAFIKQSTCQIPEFDNDLVRRLIANIKVVSAEKLIIQFQSGIVMEQEIRYD